MLIAFLALAGLLLAGWLTLRHRQRIRGGADHLAADTRTEQD
ncbi:hypothetical protein [Brevundimonas diminuta]